VGILTSDVLSYVLNFGGAVALALIAVYVHRKLKPEAPQSTRTKACWRRFERIEGMPTGETQVL
jgi:hypothetical protein